MLRDTGGQMTTQDRAQGQPRVAGRRPHRHVVLTTDEQEEQLQTLARAQSVTVARLLVDSTLRAPQLNRRALFLELAGIRRILTGEVAALDQLVGRADRNAWDPRVFDTALASLQWRDEQLVKHYGWVR